jgi:hypothetical protein
MATRDHRFTVSSRCELLPYLLRLPLGLSRKQAKDLLHFRAVTVARMTTVRHDTQLEPGDVVTIAAGKQVPSLSIKVPGCFRWAPTARKSAPRIGSSMNI